MSEDADRNLSVSVTADPETLAVLANIEQRLIGAGLCPLTVMNTGNLVGFLLQRMGADGVTLLFADWVSAIDRMRGDVSLDGETQVVKKRSPRRRKV